MSLKKVTRDVDQRQDEVCVDSLLGTKRMS